MFWHYLATALCVITNVELSIGHLLHVGLPLPRCPGAGRPFQHATANATANENHEFLSFFKFLHFIRLRKRLRHVVTCCDIASLLNPQCFRVQARHLESSSARVLGRAKCTGNVSENVSYASCDRNLTHWITWKPKKYIPLTTTYIWPVLTEIIPLADCKLRLASSTSSLVFWKSWRKNNQKGLGLQHFEEHYHGRMISLFFPHLTIKPKLLKQSTWLTSPPPWAWHWGWCCSEHQWCCKCFPARSSWQSWLWWTKLESAGDITELRGACIATMASFCRMSNTSGSSCFFMGSSCTIHNALAWSSLCLDKTGRTLCEEAVIKIIPASAGMTPAGHVVSSNPALAKTHVISYNPFLLKINTKKILGWYKNIKGKHGLVSCTSARTCSCWLSCRGGDALAPQDWNRSSHPGFVNQENYTSDALISSALGKAKCVFHEPFCVFVLPLDLASPQKWLKDGFLSVWVVSALELGFQTQVRLDSLCFASSAVAGQDLPSLLTVTVRSEGSTISSDVKAQVYDKLMVNILRFRGFRGNQGAREPKGADFLRGSLLLPSSFP